MTNEMRRDETMNWIKYKQYGVENPLLPVLYHFSADTAPVLHRSIFAPVSNSATPMMR